jgi:hypothetical protein
MLLLVLGSNEQRRLFVCGRKERRRYFLLPLCPGRSAVLYSPGGTCVVVVIALKRE